MRLKVRGNMFAHIKTLASQMFLAAALGRKFSDSIATPKRVDLLNRIYCRNKKRLNLLHSDPPEVSCKKLKFSGIGKGFIQPIGKHALAYTCLPGIQKI